MHTQLAEHQPVVLLWRVVGTELAPVRNYAEVLSS
jgi:hypothetical protein